MTTPETPVDSELNFEWPNASGRRPRGMPAVEWRPLARRASDRRPPAERSDPRALRQELDEARAEVERLQADRRAARRHIDELEAARDILQGRVTAQRRRLLLLERQLEGINVEPATDIGVAASWLDRLFGGFNSVPTA